jgi:hypothetical protein
VPLPFNLLCLLLLVFLTVVAQKMMNYSDKGAELKIRIGLKSSLFVHMLKKLIDGHLLEILKTHLKMMDGCKNFDGQILK